MCQICLWPKTCRTKNIPISLNCVLFTAHQMLAFSRTLLNTSQQNKHWQCTCLQNMTPHFFMLHFYVVMTAALNSGPVSWNHVNNHQWFHDLSVSRPGEGKLTGLSAAGRRPDIILKTSNGSTLTNPSSLPSSSWKSKNIWFCCHQHDSSGFSPVHHHSLHLLTWSSYTCNDEHDDEYCENVNMIRRTFWTYSWFCRNVKCQHVILRTEQHVVITSMLACWC